MMNTENTLLSYTLIRRKMTHIRIRVTGDAQVVVSAPLHVSKTRIETFLRENEAVITRQLTEVRNRRSTYYPSTYADGDSFYYLGKQAILKTVVSGKRTAVFSEGTLTLFLPDGMGLPERKASFARWARREAKVIFEERLKMLPFPAVQGVKISVKNMLTRWGSINPRRRTMSLSVHLLRCDTELIDYIITHELCHLNCPSHSKAFYAVLESYYPARKQLDKRLERYGLVDF